MGKIFTAAMLLMFSSTASAKTDHYNFRPAVIKGGEATFQQKFKWPKIKLPETFNAVYVCNIHLSTAGFVRTVGCIEGQINIDNLNENQDKALRRGVEDTYSDVEFRPAVFEDRGVPVSVYSSNVLICSDNNCEIRTVLNRGLSESKFGFEYIAPQQIVDGKSFYRKLYKKVVLLSHVNDRVINLEVTTKVDIHGNHSGHKISGHTPRRLENYGKAAVSIMDTYSYIPGYFQGEPVEMDWYGWLSRNLLGRRHPER